MKLKKKLTKCQELLDFNFHVNYLNLNLVSKFGNIFLILLSLIKYNITLISHSLLILK